MRPKLDAKPTNGKEEDLDNNGDELDPGDLNDMSEVEEEARLIQLLQFY